jgi:hypothetical protein
MSRYAASRPRNELWCHRNIPGFSRRDACGSFYLLAPWSKDDHLINIIVSLLFAHESPLYEACWNTDRGSLVIRWHTLTQGTAVRIHLKIDIRWESCGCVSEKRSLCSEHDLPPQPRERRGVSRSCFFSPFKGFKQLSVVVCLPGTPRPKWT